MKLPVSAREPATSLEGTDHLSNRVGTRLLVLWKTGRLLAVAVVAGVVCYSVAVLLTVAGTGDMGLRCVFKNQVISVQPYRWNSQRESVDRKFRVSQPGAASWSWSAQPPPIGATLLAIGPRTITTYHDYINALRDVAGAVNRVVEVGWRDGAGTHLGQVRVQRPPREEYLWSLVWFAQEMVVFAIGFLVFWKRPRDESAQTFFWLCVATVGAFMGGYHWTQIVVHPPLIYLFVAFAVFVPMLSLHFYLVFPRLNPWFARYRRPLHVVIFSLPVLSCLAMWSCMLWSARVGINVQRALDILEVLALGYVWLSVGIFILCLACLTYSFVRARSRAERNQVQWILLATLLSFVPITYLLWDTWNDHARLGLSSSAWPMFTVSLFYTVAYATSITRYKLMQAEVFLSRGVVYFLISLAAGLLYSGGLVVTAMIVGDKLLVDKTTPGVLVAVLTAVVILVLSEAARHQFQRALDRRFYREKYKFDQAMHKMSQAVGSLVDRATLGHRLLESAAEVLRLDWGAIYLRDPGGGPLALAACVGPEPDEAVIADANPLLNRMRQSATFRVPHSLSPSHDPVAADALIRLGGEVAVALNGDGLAGLVVLGPKRSGLPYENEEIAFLGALGSVASLAVRSADIQATLEMLNHELRDKVEKIAEQRRRILLLQTQLAGRPRDGLPPPADEAPETGRPTRPAPVDNEAFAAIKGSSRALRRTVELAQGGGQSVGRLDPRRERHRQGVAGRGHPQGQFTRRPAVRESPLRGVVPRPARKRALRPRQGGLHRRRARPRGTVPAGRRRHPVPR